MPDSFEGEILQLPRSQSLFLEIYRVCCSLSSYVAGGTKFNGICPCQIKDSAHSNGLSTIAKKLGKPEEAVHQKIRRLGLEVVEHGKMCALLLLLFSPEIAKC